MRKSNREKGIAFVVIMIVLVVVCLGILSLSNGVSNMTRSAKNFDRSNQCYDAANAGLTVARGYLAGLVQAVTPAASYNLPAVSLGNTSYAVQVTRTAQYSHNVLDNDGHPTGTIEYHYNYTLVSTGQNLPAKRALTQEVRLTRDVTSALVYDPWVGGDWSVLTGGNLTINGAAGTGKVHTNGKLTINGNASGVDDDSSAHLSAPAGFISGAPYIFIPEAPIEGLRNKTLDFNKDGTVSQAEMDSILVVPQANIKNALKNLPATVKHILIEGDFDTNGLGNMTLNCNIVATGAVDMSGNVTVNGLVYAQNKNNQATAISLSGTAGVNGMLITKGCAIVTGTFDAVFSTVWITDLLDFLTVGNLQTTSWEQTLEETDIIKETNCS